MEKQKLQPGPKPRAKRVLPPPGDFIALGKSSSSKPRSVNESELIKPIQPAIRKPVAGGSSHLPSGQKRKESSPVNPVPSKQARTFSPSFTRNKDKSLDIIQVLPAVKFVDAPPIELEEMTLSAVNKDNVEQIEGLLCGAIRTMKMNRLKPDPMIYLTMMNLAKSNAAMFLSKKVTEHMLQFLRRENTLTTVKAKPNTLLSIMTCNILLHAYQNEDSWPQSFMKVYVEDAIGDRSWVDNEHNKEFVGNITKVFCTILPKKPTLSNRSVVTETSTATITPVENVKGEEERVMEKVGISIEEEESSPIRNRYFTPKDELAVQNYVLDVVKEQLNKRQMIDSVSRNTVRFLAAVCGYLDVRLLASQKIETWLQNPKLTRPTQELLMSVALNCNTHTNEDILVIGNLVKMRLKAKPVANHYINCMKELFNQHPDNLGTTLKRVIYNELSQQRNPNNMPLISAMFAAQPELSPKYLSIVFQDLLCNREDYLKAVRALFREIVRTLKHEINLVEFCRGMMQERKDPLFLELEQPLKDRMFASVIDLINLGCFLSVSQAVKEQSSSLNKGDKRDYSVLQAFQMLISTIQRDAIWFFQTKAKNIYNCSERDFIAGLHRVLFIEPTEMYSQRDNWPPESERNHLIQLVTEVPLTEDGLLRLHLLGLSEDSPMNYSDALEIIEKMVHRAAVLSSGLLGLDLEKTEVLAMLLSLSTYSHPKEIALPADYHPPTLAIKNLYWRAWLVLLILAGTNPSTIGIKVWDIYPTARCLMEMLITGCYVFPPFSVDGMSPSDVKAHELQIARAEKEDILVFEGHLAASSRKLITESNSLLIDQLISLNPSGPARQPPDYVMDQLKQLNEKYKLGKLLCQSRTPDFLLSIIQNQGSSKSMPWLADLVQSSEGSLEALPLQCLCEFVLMKHSDQDTEEPSSNRQRAIKSKVASRLKDLLAGSEATEQTSSDLINYFISRWYSSILKEREAAVNGFKMIVLYQKKIRKSSTAKSSISEEKSSTEQMSDSKTVINDDDCYAWLHETLLSFPFISKVLPEILTAIRKALHLEMNAVRLQAYISFLHKHHPSQDAFFFNLLIRDLSLILTWRKTVSRAIFQCSATNAYQQTLHIFSDYLKLKIFRNEDINRDVEGDVFITWTSGYMAGKSLVCSVDVIKACFALLTFGKVLVSETTSIEERNEDYGFLLSVWLPFSSYTCENEEGKTQKIFDRDIRLAMLQSNVEQLEFEGLTDVSIPELIELLTSTGIPLRTKEKVLRKLDEISESKPKQILNSTLEKDKVLKNFNLVKSQGAMYGEKFHELLQNHFKKGSPKATVVQKNVPVRENFFSTPSLPRRKVKKDVPKSFQSIEDVYHVFYEIYLLDNTVLLLALKQHLSKENVIHSKNPSMGTESLAQMTLQVLLENFKQNTQFVKSFCSKNFSCVLLRILSLSHVNKSEQFETLLTEIQQENNKTNQLNDTVCKLIAQLFPMKSSKKQTKATSESALQSLLNSQGMNVVSSVNEFLSLLKADRNNDMEFSKEILIKAGLFIQKNVHQLFEKFIKVLCMRSQSMRNDKVCVDVIAELMKNGEDSGILVDWLSLLDPEILQLNPILLREVLFTKKHTSGDVPEEREQENGEDDDAVSSKDDVGKKNKNCVAKRKEKNNATKKKKKPTDNVSGANEDGDTVVKKPSNSGVLYLTSLLTHETRNSTLQDCIHWILSSPRLLDSFHATGCLDFLTTMVNNPRIWKGRENKQTDKMFDVTFQDVQTMDQSCVFELSLQQTYHLVHLILMELMLHVPKTEDEMTDEVVERVTLLMEKRLSLLLTLSKDAIVLQKAINLTKQFKKFPDHVIQHFLRYFYMKQPTLCGLSKDVESNNLQSLPSNIKTEMDLVLHRLIMSISTSDSSERSGEKFKSIAAIQRRLAVDHPFASMRQLPLLLSLMKGKNRLSASIFKRTNQLELCRHVFNLFDMLRPHIFSESENLANIMSAFIEVFMEIIHAPCLNNDNVATFVGKLSEFLTRYISSGNKNAGKLLKVHEETFRDLLYDFPNLQDLRTIVTFLVMYDENANSQSSLVSLSAPQWTKTQVRGFCKRLAPEHHQQDLLTVLRELADASKRKVSVIKDFLDELSELLFSNNSEIREQTHRLMLRYYQYHPSTASRLIELYIRCLRDNNPDVVDSAAKYASEGILLSDVKCDELLQTLYDKASTSRSSLDTYIKTAVKNFNIDYDV